MYIQQKRLAISGVAIKANYLPKGNYVAKKSKTLYVAYGIKDWKA